MGRNIDFEKPISEDDEAWLRSRGRGWQVDEAKRVQEDKKKGAKAEGGPSEEVWIPSNQPPAQPFDEPGPSSRQVPFPVGVDGQHVDRTGGESEVVEEVDPEDMTVDDLKDELRARELPVSGNRDELVKRLKKDLKEKGE